MTGPDRSDAGGRAASVRAQAKVNLRLKVLSREESGYHAIETVFARLDLADVVTVRVGGGERSIACRGADCGPDQENLAFRAALDFAEYGWPAGFAIEIDKQIPVGAGLGGGSADAGAVLRALNALRPGPLPRELLLRLATRLGADVPFLTTEAAAALAWGRGERMLALPPLPARDVWMFAPDHGIATRDAYGWLAERRAETEPHRPQPVALTLEALGSWTSMRELAENDFEPIVFERHPGVAELRTILRSLGAEVALMSGSGSAVFGVFGSGGPLVYAMADVVPAAELADLHRRGVRFIQTRTAERVEPVHLEEPE